MHEFVEDHLACLFFPLILLLNTSDRKNSKDSGARG